MNFLPLEPYQFHFPIYARIVASPDESKPEGVYRYDLPDTRGNQSEPAQYVPHDVSFTSRPGFAYRDIASSVKPPLSCRYVGSLLQQTCIARLSPISFEESKSFGQKIFFLLAEFPEGRQMVWLSPYYLRATKTFGFLADFRFKLQPGKTFSRKVQQLSLSLDSHFRDNSNFYVDRFQKLQQFLTRYASRLFPLQCSNGDELNVSLQLQGLPTRSLKPKVFLFGDGTSSNSQFLGVKEHGPLEPADENTLLCFIYKEPDRPLSHDLFRALRGDTFTTFPGMQKMFRFQLDRVHVQGVAVDGFSVSDVEGTVQRLVDARGSRLVVPIVLVPWNRHDGPEASDSYYRLKHLFLSNGLPSQFICSRTVEDPNALKWSVSNIGLGIFSKLGGQPWKIRPQNNRCLIIGVGQAHEFDRDHRITRHFAYSVLTDSSGLYTDLKILSREPSEPTYLKTLTHRLMDIFASYSAKGYDKFAIHATFSLRQQEMDAIRESIRAYTHDAEGGKEFVVLKFDDDSKYFGYDESANSMVPYEGSYIKLSKTEFLMWFEGLQKNRPNVRGKIGRPVHVEFRYPARDELSDDQMRGHVQDAVNLSGANWRGFNAKSLPISIYYAKLIADYFREFHRLGLDELNLENLTPWFL
ncbi:Piwi domain-containing protein [Aquisphaera insulae]|uniref:Piwi domain-containing protein n=1 Tax=Aquisphaera insulae TaxID=2712864 RepID=UPI0013EA382A|nr:Piwi domain-containing protein [Aquisphaera insulae]